jgi:hypothetical protein
MNLADASNEFNLRHYIWSKAEWEKEINESFPHLRLFKTGLGWTLYQFMQKLNKEEQLVFAMGRLKKMNRGLASKWGEHHLSEKEESMCRKFLAFHDIRRQFQAFKQHRSDLKASDARILFDASCAEDARVLCSTDSTDADFLAAELEDFLNSFPQSFEEQVKARKLSGEKIKFVSKKRLQKILTEKVKDIFGNQYEECRVDEGHRTAFDIKCGDWMLQTQFNFGRKPGYQQSVLGYWHNVCTQERAPHHAMPEVMCPVAHLCMGVSWPCSFEWEYLREEDVECACSETFKYCRRFFEAAPRLLKGLDVEELSEDHSHRQGGG